MKLIINGNDATCNATISKRNRHSTSFYNKRQVEKLDINNYGMSI